MLQLAHILIAARLRAPFEAASLPQLFIFFFSPVCTQSDLAMPGPMGRRLGPCLVRLFMRYLNKLLVEYLWHFVMERDSQSYASVSVPQRGTNWKLSTSCLWVASSIIAHVKWCFVTAAKAAPTAEEHKKQVKIFIKVKIVTQGGDSRERQRKKGRERGSRRGAERVSPFAETAGYFSYFFSSFRLAALFVGVCGFSFSRHSISIHTHTQTHR